MLDRSSKFFLLSKEIAESFLQTTVIVDDQASFGNETKDVPAKVSKLTNPNRGRTKSTPLPSLITPSSVDDQGSAHQLDAKVVIDSFANKGIVCSVLKPDVTDKQQILPTVEKLAICTDIFIVDWDLCEDSGTQTLKLIKSITKSSLTPNRKLRLIVVYTGEPGIVGISKKIRTALLEPVGSTRAQDLREEDNGFAFITSSTRIVVFAKPHTSRIPQHLEDRKVDFHKLVERVIEEFTLMTAGLVSNLVLHSLAAIRNNTHRILGRFGAELDPAYLTHRALQLYPEDAEEHLLPLMMGELQALLQGTNVSENMNFDAVKSWCEAHHTAPFRLTIPTSKGDEEKILEQPAIDDLLSRGLEGLSSYLSKSKASKAALTKMFQPAGNVATELDERFAVITTHRTFYKEGERIMTLGTVVKCKPRGKPASYYVCVQPRCDSVRLKKPRAFPFLPLVSPDNIEEFDTILIDDDKYIRLKVSKKPYDLHLITFDSLASDNGSIISVKHVFTDINKKKYTWMGEWL